MHSDHKEEGTFFEHEVSGTRKMNGMGGVGQL
jgi:hypothetical protein